MDPTNFWSSGFFIFPLIMMIIMMFFMSRMFGRGALNRPGWAVMKEGNNPRIHPGAARAVEDRRHPWTY